MPAAIAGSGAPQAGEVVHFTPVEGAFFSGEAFASQPGIHAAIEQPATRPQPAQAAASLSAVRIDSHYTPEEYLFFTDVGFESGGAGSPAALQTSSLY